MASLRVRKGKDKRSRWYCRYNFEGKQVELSLGAISKSKAQQVLVKVENLLIEGNDPKDLFQPEKKEEVVQLTLRQLIREFQKYKSESNRNRPSTIVSRERVLGSLPRKLLSKPVIWVKTQDIEVWLAKYSKSHNPAGTNLALRYIKSVLNYAVDRDIILRNPARPIHAAPVDEKPKYRALSDEQVQFLLQNSERGSWFHRGIYIALHFGMRAGEIIRVKYSDIDQDFGSIHVQGVGTKTHKSRVIPAPSSKVIEEILSWDREHPELVVPYNSVFFLSTKFKRIVRKQGWDEVLSFHSTRHTYISNLLKHGAPLSLVSRLAGHSSVAVTDRYYSHFNNDVLGRAAAMLAYGPASSDRAF